MTKDRPRLKIACPGCLQKLDVSDLDPFARVNCPRCGGPVIAPKPFGALLLEEPLGQRHGIGSYRALDLTLDREVLVRILERDGGTLGEAFQALARRAAAVNHPGVQPIYSCGSEEGMPYLVSQFMVGGSLAARLPGRPAGQESIRQAAEWLRTVAAGLQAASGLGVVHGAVSPQSIFFDADGNAKVGDFGVDVLRFGSVAARRSCGRDLAPYVSPEVLAGAAPCAVSDIFGIGAVLYHVLTGHGPCGPGGADGAEAMRFWQERPALPSPRECAPHVPEQLSELCMRMLACDPAGRPASLEGLIEALSATLTARRGPVVPGAARPVRGLAEPAPATQAPGTPRPVAAPRPASRRAVWVDLLIAAGLAVLLLLGLGLYVRSHGWPAWFLQPQSPDRAPQVRHVQDAPRPPDELPAGRGEVARQAAPTEAARGTPGSERIAANAPPRDGGDTPPPAGEDSLPAARPAPPTGATRPKPDGLDFLGDTAALAQYLKDLPPDLLGLERERLDLIGDTRSYLVRLMKYVTFRGGQETDIRLRSGAVLRGAVAYCNEAQVAVRQPGGNRLQMVAWSDLTLEQIVAFLDFYIQLRADQGQVAGGAQNDSLRQDVADDCVRAAVLCDWYGRSELARRYAEKAVAAAPGAAARLSRLLPGSVTD